MEYLPIIIDVFIVLFPFLALIEGRKKGFAAIVIPLLVTILCFSLCSAYAPKIAQELNESLVHEKLVEFIEEKLNTAIDNGVDNLEGAFPNYLMAVAEQLDYSKESLISNLKIPEISLKIATYSENSIIIPTLTAFVYVLLFIISKFLGKMLVIPANIVAKLPLIRNCNHILGAIAGLLLGLVRLFIILVIISVALVFTKDSQFSQIILQTHILQYLLDNMQLLF